MSSPYKVKFHPSSVALIMTDAKSIDPAFLTDPEIATISRKTKKTDEDKAILEPLWDRSLSVGAKTLVKSMVREYIFEFRERITTKYMDKGIAVEDTAIELYNSRFFTNYKKNEETKSNDWLIGTCDIDTGSKIIDIKSSWHLPTFPLFAEDARDNLYEWQGRGYMMLWDREEFELAFCMVDTPEELIKWEQAELHKVSHLPVELRVTTVTYMRDMALERKMVTKIEAAQAYFAKLIEQVKLEHGA